MYVKHYSLLLLASNQGALGGEKEVLFTFTEVQRHLQALVCAPSATCLL